MAPNADIMANIPMRVADDESFSMRRIAFDGWIIEQNTGDLDDVNFNSLVSNAWIAMPTMVDYFACVNCLYPIGRKQYICNVITAPRHAYIHTAYCVPLDHVNATIVSFSNIHWENHAKCRNCRISLTVRALNMFNVQADEYANDRRCIILDASCIVFLRKE